MAKRKKRVRARSTATMRLRQRLKEAEETIAAIRDGHVEALVVRAQEGGEQIFTLRSADQPYRLMVEQMREGALTVAADGAIVYCNNRFAELVSSPTERIVGQNLRRFVDERDHGIVALALAADDSRHDFRLRTASGMSNPAQLSSASLVIDGVRMVAMVVTDLTHERIERGLRESNRLKDEFLATLSHELRTPLNVILGWTRMLLADHLQEPARRHALELIDRNAHAQAQLVNDLVDMSRMSTGKLRLDLEPLPIAPAVEAALESIRPAAQARRLSVEASSTAGDANVLADPTRLQQVLWNLLSNAVKFTPEGGRIAIDTTTLGDRVRVAVSDSGIGIDRGFLPHVFDRFRQADSGTTRSYGGLGLGLAIVHDLVRLHGGDVAVQSDGIGRGATFSFTLRTAAAPASPRKPRPRMPSDLAGLSVMVLEDHDDSRELMVRALEASGALVVAFGTAAEAFAALERVRPSVIVADIGLPAEDGYSFIRRVRAHSALEIQTVPAIAVTAYATVPDRDEALAVGFQRHVAKPIDPADLIAVIDEIVSRSSRK